MARAAVIQGSFPHGMAHIRAQLPVQRQSNHRASPTVLTVQLTQAPPLPVHGGQPLPADVRQRMESVFATSFADVRIHMGPQASAIGAEAFTQGSHIHFAPGRYDPQTQRGRELLGRELAHVVQQRAGRVRNPFGSGVAAVHDPALEAEATRMGQRASVAQPKMPAGRAPVQRLRDLVAGTMVQVDENGQTWFGQIDTVVDANNYNIRVGGTDRIVRKGQAAVSFHPTVNAMANARGAAVAATMPNINIAAEVTAFGNGGTLPAAIVTAQQAMNVDRDTGRETIAIFNYMDHHAAALGAALAEGLALSARTNREQYLIGFSLAMTPKLGRAVWADTDRQNVLNGTTTATACFREGKRRMLALCTIAQQRGVSLTRLLEADSYNNDAKSYGRRAESWTEASPSKAALLNPPVIARPPVNAAIPLIGSGFLFRLRGSFDEVEYLHLQPHTDYDILVDLQAEYEVRTSAVGGGSVTFSSVT